MVISDSRDLSLETFLCRLPDNLMAATLEGQRQFLSCTQEPVLFVGADCLLIRDPRSVLAGDMTVTIGPFSDCEMNTGAIWCAGSQCASVWREALERNPTEWGDDQTALYSAAQASILDVRHVPCELHNWAPESPTDNAGMPTVVHFRGRRKAWMAGWAKQYLEIG